MSIPKSLVESILSTALSPEVLGGVASLFAAAGHPLDLGPMTPDARRHAKAIDDRIAAKLDERSELDRARSRQVGALGIHVHRNDAHDTDPAMPAVREPGEPSER